MGNLRYKPPLFSFKNGAFINSKKLLHTLKLSLKFGNYLLNQNKNYSFMIKKDLSFCDQNLQ